MGSIVIFRISSCPPLFVVYQYHTCNWFYFSYFLLYIPDDKKLVVEMYEKQGGRHQIFEVDNEDLVRAETINELQVR